MIEFKNVSKKYKNGTIALENINLKVEDGEFVYIMGPTGSGKSTLIKLLDGEEVPTGGSVIVSGVNVGRLRKSKVYLYRRKIGVVFQDYRLLPEKTVFENIAYALEVLDLPNDKIKKRVREVLKLVDLSDKSNAKPRELSGGQQQRVAIARAVAKRPAILIADEPTGNLDPSMTDEMITLLERINKEEKTTLLVVTHNDVMVEYHPKRTIKIESGHIIDDGLHANRSALNLSSSRKGHDKNEAPIEAKAIEHVKEEVKVNHQADEKRPAHMKSSQVNPEAALSKRVVHKEHVLNESETQEMLLKAIYDQEKVLEELNRRHEQ